MEGSLWFHCLWDLVEVPPGDLVGEQWAWNPDQAAVGRAGEAQWESEAEEDDEASQHDQAFISSHPA